MSVSSPTIQRLLPCEPLPRTRTWSPGACCTPHGCGRRRWSRTRFEPRSPRWATRSKSAKPFFLDHCQSSTLRFG